MVAAHDPLLGVATPLIVVAVVAVAAAVSGCSGGPAGPSLTTTLPLASQTASMRYYHEAGDSIDVERQEVFNAWALGRLGVQPPQPVEYRMYLSREAMGRYTGNANTNGFAEPERWRFHTIWPFDNHEVVHVYTAMIGRPSDFFNEGIAVSFQVDPARGDFTVRFNGQQVHEACRAYLIAGTLPGPLSRYVTTEGFRSIQDSVLGYRMAGSFVLHLIERFGLPAVLGFFGGSTRGDPLDTIESQVRSSFGLSVGQAEADWLERLRR